MREYIVKNFKIYISLFLSAIFVFYIFPFFLAPEKITRSLTNFSGLMENLEFPKISNLFTLNYHSDNTYQVKDKNSNYQNSFNLPSVKPQPTLQSYAQPTIPINNLITTPIPSISNNFITPTYTLPINPTLTPKPTKPPKPTPTPLAPPEYLRPGTGLDDIFNRAGQLTCVPPALLKAFVAQEAPGVLNWTDQQALFYNAYDWWHRVKTLKEVCAGYGWHPETGLVAEDSLFAGEKCKEPFSAETANDTYSQSLGATQMLKSYWEKTFKDKTKQKLKVSPVDRRVLIDSLVGFGIHLKEDTGHSGSCTNWDFKYVAKAACVNAGGTCSMYNYCTTICNNYNKFAKTSYACSGAANLFIEGTFCQFK